MAEDRLSGDDVAGAAGDLGEVMGQVARRLQRDHGDVEATLEAITDGAVHAVPGAEDAGITYVIGRRTVESRAMTSEIPREIDTLQERLQEGPCLDAVWEERIVRVDDVSADDRWPRFTEEAPRVGVASMMSFQLFVDGDRLGALNLYSRSRAAFGDEDQEIGLLFAGHAAVALAGARHEENLRRGMDSRDLIGQAKGMLMERYKLTAAQGFAVLARVSQELNRKLLDVAAELVDTGVMPAVDRSEPRRPRAGWN